MEGKFYTEKITFRTFPIVKEEFVKAQQINNEKFNKLLLKFCRAFNQKFSQQDYIENENARYKYSYIYEIKFLSYVYVGKHQTNDFYDGYLGSGLFVSTFKEDFGHLYEKRILEFCNDRNIYDKETEYIIKYKALYGNACVNVLTIPDDSERVRQIVKKLKEVLYPQSKEDNLQ